MRNKAETSKKREAARVSRKASRGVIGIPFVPRDTPKLPETQEAIMANSDRLAAELERLRGQGR